MPWASLYHIQLKPSQDFIAEQVTIHYEIPFEKEYAMGVPLSHLVKAITRLIAK